MDESSASRLVDLPIRLDAPRSEHVPTIYRFETEVRLPSRMRGKTLWFVVPELLATSTLVVDGEHATAVTGSSWDVAWTSGPHVYEVPSGATRDGHVRFAWSVRRVWKPNDWIDSAPELHPAGELGSRASASLDFGLIGGSLGVGGASMIGFAAFIVWAARREDRRNLYLAASTMLGASFYAFEAGWFQLVGGERSIHVVAIAYSLCTWFASDFTAKWFDVRVWPRWFAMLPAAVIVCTVVTWNRPSLAFVSSVPIAAVCAFLCLGAHVVALRPGRPNSDAYSTTVWLGWIAFASLSSTDQLYYYGFGDLTGGIRTSSLGALIWGCSLQQALMSTRVKKLETTRDALEARALDARRANEALEVMKRDLERLAGQDADADPMLRVLESTASRRKGPRLRPGAIVDERYEVLGTLGIGGMGTVYDVRRIADDERFALKIAHHLDGETLARLAREAWVAATVRSARVIAIHDVGVAPEGYLFFVMERFPGVAASSCSNRYGDVAWVTSVLADCARGLADLHEAGIVHRDLKPPNILVADTPEGTVAKVADFGISRFDPAFEAASGMVRSDRPMPRAISERAPRSALFGEAGDSRPDAPSADTNSSDETPRSSITDSFATRSTGDAGNRPTPTSSLTQVGAIAGTVAYMAPEVARGTTTVAREADIFGFGVIAYEMLVGSRPFRSSLDAEPMVVDGMILAASIGVHDVELAPRLIRTLDMCLAIDPSERPTAKELVRAFETSSKAPSSGSRGVVVGRLAVSGVRS